MTDQHVVPIPTPQKDERRALMEAQVRNLEALSELAPRITTVQKRFYDAYKAAGFDDWDARNMALEYKPSFL